MNIPVKITKELDDSICNRASIGGTPDIGYYLVYRGNVQEILSMLEHVTKILQQEAPKLE